MVWPDVVTLVLALCFKSIPFCSADEAFFFMKKGKSHVAVPYSTSFLS